MLTRKAKYALKALIALAGEAPGVPVRIADLARRQRIPKKFLEVILLDLRRAGVLESRKGQGGGYLLAGHPETVRIGEVVRLFDGPLAPVPCASQTAYQRCADCPDEAACGVRQVMKAVRDASARILDSTSLADLAAARPGRGRRR